MRPGAGYLLVESQSPLLGLDTSIPSTNIDPKSSPSLLNMVVRDGIVRRRAGGDQVGRRLMGRVLYLAEFQAIGGTPYNVALTSKRQYAYVPADHDWKDLTPGQVDYDLVGGDTPTNTMWVAGDQTLVFTVGLEFPVVDAGVNTGIYTVVSATFFGGNTLIEVAETIPNTGTLAAAGKITLADELTTQDDDLIDAGAITDLSGKRFLMTNGRDPALVWTGTITDMFAVWSPTFTDLAAFKTFEVFNEHLFLGDVTIGASEEPQLIAWSSAGNFDDFETGDSGAQILYQLNGPIKWLLPLGDRLAIYSNDTIMTGVYIGGAAVFAFEVVVPEGVRLPAPLAITTINVGHIYLSEENIYLFDGTRGLRVLGRQIAPDYKGVKNSSTIQRACALNDFAKRTLYFAVPDLSGSTTIYTALYDVFDLGNITWSKEKYHDTVSAWGFFVNRSEAYTWEDTSWENAAQTAPYRTWDEEVGTWGEEGEQLTFPNRSYGTTDGRVIIATEGIAADRRQTVSSEIYETKDFEIPEIGQSLVGRWGEIEFEASGTQVNVIVSTDKGRTYHGVSTVVLTEHPEMYKLPIDYSSRTMRVKFITTGNVFSLRGVKLWVRPGGP